MGKTSENDDWSKDFGDFSVLFWLLLKPKKNRTWSQKLPKARSIPANACRAPPPRAHRGSICCTSWRTSARRRCRHVSLDWSLVQAYQFVSTCIYLLFTAHTVIPKNRGERVCVCVYVQIWHDWLFVPPNIYQKMQDTFQNFPLEEWPAESCCVWNPSCRDHPGPP